jgi:hypothetical protein
MIMRGGLHEDNARCVEELLDTVILETAQKASIMGNILGKDKPLKEVLRENKRMINKAIRELDREKAGLEREEKRLTMEIKKAARENQMNSVKIMAKVSEKLRVLCVRLCFRLQALMKTPLSSMQR